jgi:hypothetical protein
MKTIKKVVSISIVFWGFVFLFYMINEHHLVQKKKDAKYCIENLASVSCTSDRLEHNVLLSLLQLTDQSGLYEEKTCVLEQRITRCPSIEAAKVYLLPPKTLGVEYRLRQPIALLGGMKNIALDETGRLFFVMPFMPQKNLPQLLLGIAPCDDLETLQLSVNHLKTLAIGLHLVKNLSCLSLRFGFTLTIVDLSSWEEMNFFRKEVVIGFTLSKRPEQVIYVRLHPKRLRSSLCVLESLMERLHESMTGFKVIDMRFPGRVFLF